MQPVKWTLVHKNLSHNEFTSLLGATRCFIVLSGLVFIPDLSLLLLISWSQSRTVSASMTFSPFPTFSIPWVKGQCLVSCQLILGLLRWQKFLTPPTASDGFSS